MKKINLFYCLSFLFLLVACEDAIEIDQPGRLDEEAAFQNVDDLEAGLLGVYNNIDLTPEIQFTAIFTDELAIGFDNGGQGLQDYGFTLNAGSTAPRVMWTRWYSAINSANRIIEASENIEPGEGEQSTYNNILGEVYALRAFAHFQLQSYFTTDYADDSALGVIAMDYVPTIDEQLLRNTNAEVFGLIEADLDRAEDLLNVESHPTYVSQDFVTALRARMAAYRENYADAATYAEELLEKYSIPDTASYKAVFEDESTEGIIFKLSRTPGDSYDNQGSTGSAAAGGWVGAIFAFTGPGVNGSPYFEMGRSLFNELDPEDVRYDVNVHPSSVIDPDYQNSPGGGTNDILVVDKYSGSDGIPLMNDLKVFRAAEMLLILAEARVAMGDINGENSAASLLKELRDQRFGEDTVMPEFANATEAFGAILDERRIEFAFEGHRYKDLKRLGERGNRQIQRDPVDCAFNGACSLSPTDHRFTFPLPIVEFNANPGLREQQNPGY